MNMIGKVAIKYVDVALGKTLHAMRGYRTDRRRSAAEHSKYFLPEVTREALMSQNVILNTVTGKCDRSDSWSAYQNEDNVVFSGRPGILTTHANACFSYMLFSKQAKLAAAAHVYSSHLSDPSFHVKTILYALANLKKMSPHSPISAHICGGFALYEIEAFRKSMMFYNQEILREVAFEMLKWGVVIRSINAGDDYLSQELRTDNWQYAITLMAPGNEALKYRLPFYPPLQG